jgi:excisionase family DNA binding protein
LSRNATNGSTYGSVEELAEDLGISRTSAYQALRRGQFPHLKIGKRIIIPRAAIRQWMLTAATPGTPAEA